MTPPLQQTLASHPLTRLAAMLVVIAAAGCATERPPGVAFYENDYAYAIAKYKELASRKDKNFALYSCDLGEACLAAGDLMDAKEAFLDATMVMNDIADGQLRGLGSLIGSEATKVFKGDPFEKAMVDAHNGIVLYALGDYENAAVGFKRALLADKDSAEGFRDDFGLAHYMLGKSLVRLGQVEDARVEFRNAQRCVPNNPYLNLEANRAANFTIVIDMGMAPLKVETGPAGSMDTYQRAPFPESYAKVFADGKRLGRSAEILDLYYQAAHSGRSAKDAVQAAKGAAKLSAAGVAMFARDDRVRLIALLFALLYPSGADVRQCDLLPGQVHVLIAKLKPGTHTIRLQFYTSSGSRLPSYDQCWYHIPIRDRRETLLYCRSIPYRGYWLKSVSAEAATP